MNRTMFRIETAVLALPALAFTLWALPNIALWVGAGVSAVSSGNASLHEVTVVPAILVVGLFALSVVARLVVATAMGRAYHVGVVFWLGLVCGLSLVVYLYMVFAPQVALIVGGPLLLLASHASYIQRHELQQAVPADQPRAARSAGG